MFLYSHTYSCFIYLLFDPFFIQFLFVQATIEIYFHIITASNFFSKGRNETVTCVMFDIHDTIYHGFSP